MLCCDVFLLLRSVAYEASDLAALLPEQHVACHGTRSIRGL